jgi:hypothetical protein
MSRVPARRLVRSGGGAKAVVPHMEPGLEAAQTLVDRIVTQAGRPPGP